MNQTQFAELFESTVEQCRMLLIVKGGEYAGAEDRLANFKRGSALVGVTPLQCLFIYMSKHYDSISTYIRKDAATEKQHLSEPIEGRLDDLINYAILAKALIREAGMQPKEVQEKYNIGVMSQADREEQISNLMRGSNGIEAAAQSWDGRFDKTVFTPLIIDCGSEGEITLETIDDINRFYVLVEQARLNKNPSHKPAWRGKWVYGYRPASDATWVKMP